MLKANPDACDHGFVRKAFSSCCGQQAIKSCIRLVLNEKSALCPLQSFFILHHPDDMRDTQDYYIGIHSHLDDPGWWGLAGDKSGM